NKPSPAVPIAPAVAPWWKSPPRQVLIAGGVGLGLLAILIICLVISGNRSDKHQSPTTVGSSSQAPQTPVYTKRATRQATYLATLKANGLPDWEGKWWTIGPFDNPEMKGFATVYPPEREIDLGKSYTGKDNLTVAWKEWPDFRLGVIEDLKR